MLGRLPYQIALGAFGLALLVSFAPACDGGGDDASTGAGGSTSAGGAGGNSTGGSGGSVGPPTLEVVEGAPAAPSRAPDTKTYAVTGYASAVGANGPLVAIGTTTDVYQATPQGLVQLPIVGDEPDLPQKTGTIRAIAPYGDGLLVAADEAIFYTTGDVLLLSKGNVDLHPLGISQISARTADEDGDDKSETYLTLIAGDGAYELFGTSLTKWTVDGESGAPTAAFAQKNRLYLAFGDRVYEVDKTSNTAYPLVFDIGSVSAIACDSLACDEGSLLYFATDKGLVERGSDGGYSLYTLADKGSPGVPTETFAFDGGRQRLYAIAADWVLRVKAGEVPEAVATFEKGDFPRRVAFDKLGDMWAGTSDAVQSFALGTPLSFEIDVKPIMHEYCAICHAGGIKGAPKIDFETHAKMVEFADVVIERVADGSMPPPGYQAIPKEKYQIILDWAVTKTP